jgi:hypothetical protein
MDESFRVKQAFIAIFKECEFEREYSLLINKEIRRV